MMPMEEKLAILADAAKYDASCASSAAKRKDSSASGGIGSTEGMGICHSYAPDGRCISLLKVLLTNYCRYDCQYCVNRRSSDVRRAKFRVRELVDLTLDFYRRNYIEGLFLSSGIAVDPDDTMEQLVAVARELRVTHGFNGYIHLKTIPDADPALITEAGRYADRLSINVELPTRSGLGRLAPEKNAETIRGAMGRLRETLDEDRAEARRPGRAKSRLQVTGQSTQMIVGADDAPDARILATSHELYDRYRLKRVYYSAFSPTPHPAASLPVQPPPLVREHRLYQADWLLRFYGFSVDEIVASTRNGMLDLEVDPKLAWALAHRETFPVDVNRATREQLLRVPGLGARSVQGILRARRQQALRLDDVLTLGGNRRKAIPFITTRDWHPGALLERQNLRSVVVERPVQQDLFAPAA